jgi:hypothetical protein
MSTTLPPIGQEIEFPAQRTMTRDKDGTLYVVDNNSTIWLKERAVPEEKQDFGWRTTVVPTLLDYAQRAPFVVVKHLTGDETPAQLAGIEQEVRQSESG